MAYIGLAYPTFAKLNTATNTYSNGFRFGKAVDVNISVNYNEAKLPGDNVIAEIAKEFKDGNMDLGITTIPITAYSVVFGHEVDTTTEAGVTDINDKSDDTSNYVGVGLIKEEMIDGVKSYIAMWIWKVLFVETSESATTKGENISFQTPKISGSITPLDNKKWRRRKIYKSEAAAIAFINSMAGLTAQCTAPLASVASGTYEEAQSVTLTAGSGEAIYYTTNGTTPSATNGTLYAAAITVSASQAIKAVATKSGSSDSGIATFEYIISA